MNVEDTVKECALSCMCSAKFCFEPFDSNHVKINIVSQYMYSTREIVLDLEVK